MPDEVHYKVPFPVGNTKRRDVGYWPTVIDDQIPSPDLDEDEREAQLFNWFTLELSRERYEEMIWRVRHWRIVGTLAVTVVDTTSTPTTLFNIEWNLDEETDDIQMRWLKTDVDDDVIEVMTERQLLGRNHYGPDQDLTPLVPTKNFMSGGVRNDGMQSGLDKSSEDYDPTIFDADTFEVDHNLVNGGGFGLTDLDPEDQFNSVNASFFNHFLPVLYNPDDDTFKLQFGGGLSVFGFYDGSKFVSASCQPKPPDYAGDNNNQVATGEIRIKWSDDEIITFPAYIFAGHTAFSTGGHVTEVTGTVDIEITPVKWWPYKNAAGDPVYDEDTGEKINDLI